MVHNNIKNYKKEKSILQYLLEKNKHSNFFLPNKKKLETPTLHFKKCATPQQYIYFFKLKASFLMRLLLLKLNVGFLQFEI